MKIGIKGKQTVTVSNSNTAAFMGSGTLEVFATPAMAALMEKTAMQSVADYLDEGAATVGTKLEIEHLSATTLGDTVTSESELVLVDGRKLCFSVTAYDSCGIIGRGTHERFIVDSEKFLKKAGNKMK